LDSVFGGFRLRANSARGTKFSVGLFSLQLKVSLVEYRKRLPGFD
jgi:hypothetical protein